jgi:hypothetical protein
MANEEQVGAPHPEPCLEVLSRAVSRHSMQVKESWDRKAMSAAQCPRPGVLLPWVGPPGMARCPSNDEQVGAPHPEPCLGVLSRAVSRHSMRVKVPSVLCGTEELGTRHLRDVRGIHSPPLHKLQTHCSMTNLHAMGCAAPCGRSATTTRLAPPAWNLTRHSVPLHTG